MISFLKSLFIVGLFAATAGRSAAAAQPMPSAPEPSQPSTLGAPPASAAPASAAPDLAQPQPVQSQPTATDAPGSVADPAPPPPVSQDPALSPAPNNELNLDQWSRDDWMLVKPRVSLLEVDGYLRLRSQLYRRLDFGNQIALEVDAQGDPASRAPPLTDGRADFSYTTMRLRIEPVININEQMQIVTTFDLLDNLVLGSTPEVLSFGQKTAPVNITSRSQVPLREGRNTLGQALVVRRVWGRVTALGEQVELRFGRMADHFGLGMLYNDGDCIDCDYGTLVDRIAVAFRLYNHIFTPMVDWVSRGPQLRPFGVYDPLPIDATSFDDTMQYTLRMVRQDHPSDIAEAIAHGRRVINYGVSNSFRLQPRDFGPTYYDNGYDPAVPPTAATPTERRDAFLYTGDAYAHLYTGHLQMAAEVAVQAGSFTDTAVGATAGQPGSLQSTSIFTLGGAVETTYQARADHRGISLQLKAGGASGDNHAGFGALDRADTQRGGREVRDRALHNFQFSPDYHLDLILFRRLLGTVTDAWYVRPQLAYRFDEHLAGHVNAVYSQAVRARSTPSRVSGTPSAPLGLELDGQLSYGVPRQGQRGQLLAALDGGVLFPLGGLSAPSVATGQPGSSFAWTVQASMALTF